MPTAQPPSLTPRQADTLKVIAARQVHRKCGPTIREVAGVLNVAGNAVQRHVEALRAAGHVEPDSGNGLIVCASAHPQRPSADPSPSREGS